MGEIMRKNLCKTLFNLFGFIMTILVILFLIYALRENIFGSNQNLINFINKWGILAPLTFILIQIIQVVFPIIPGGASCLIGVLLFGGFWGFIYNYIGLCLGSVFSFFIARKFGNKIIDCLFKKDTVDKYLGYVKSKKFDKIFIWGIFLPGAPDDLLCYIAGISGISFKKFVLTIILGKPLTLIFYSLFRDYFSLFN